MKKILSLIILFFVFGIENISAQISKWADEKYVNFLTCLNVNDDYYGAKAELIRLSEQGDSKQNAVLQPCYVSERRTIGIMKKH